MAKVAKKRRIAPQAANRWRKVGKATPTRENAKLSGFCLSAEDCKKLSEAVSFAVRAHAGQLDKGGEPYFLHCLRVMERVGKMAWETNSERLEAMIAAVLHDVLEDTDTALGRLCETFGFPFWGVVENLTRTPLLPYRDYISSIRLAQPERSIKIADLEDNLDPRRIALAKKNGHDIRPLVKRYKWALDYLRGCENS